MKAKRVKVKLGDIEHLFVMESDLDDDTLLRALSSEILLKLTENGIKSTRFKKFFTITDGRYELEEER